MGLLTVDVTPYGIVMTGDSQPIDLGGSTWWVNSTATRNRNPVVPLTLSTFRGLVGYVGTEQIDGKPTRQWLEGALAANRAAALSELCTELARALTTIWTNNAVETLLSIFIAGYEGSEPRFWWVSNGEPPMETVPSTFAAVDDLDGHWFPQHAKAGEKTASELVAKTAPSFRRGVLEAAVIFDCFRDLVDSLILGGLIGQIPTLDHFVAYARFRFELAKRIYDPRYGFITADRPAIVGNTIHAYSVDPTGIVNEHGKHLGQARRVH